MTRIVAIFAFFTDRGSPALGLTPEIDIWRTDGAHVIQLASMAEIAGGFYSYSFELYDPELRYFFRADGGVTLRDYDRYLYGNNESFHAYDKLGYIPSYAEDPGVMSRRSALAQLEEAGYTREMPRFAQNTSLMSRNTSRSTPQSARASRNSKGYSQDAGRHTRKEKPYQQKEKIDP